MSRSINSNVKIIPCLPACSESIFFTEIQLNIFMYHYTFPETQLGTLKCVHMNQVMISTCKPLKK